MNDIVIAIMPSESAKRRITRLRNEYSKRTGSVKAKSISPHITLVPLIRTEKLNTIIQILSKICEKKTTFSINLNTICSFKRPPIVYLKPEDETTLRELHELLIESIQPLKTSWIRESYTQIKGLHAQQKKLMKIYGSPYVLTHYHPHLTLSGPDGKVMLLKKTIKTNIPSISFNVTHITLLEKKTKPGRSLLNFLSENPVQAINEKVLK